MPTLPGTRIRDNGVLGSITDNPLTIAATVMNSPDLADLSMIISGQQHALITLDPFKQFGDPEIVMVTFHGPASTTATIQRGIYGTPARQHPQGTLWTHAAADADFIEIVTSSTRPTDPYEGQFIYETDTNEVRVFDGTQWVEFGSGSGGAPITLGYAQVTANQTGISTEVDLTGLSVAVTVPEGRRIQITVRTLVQGSADTARADLRIREGGTQLQLAQAVSKQANHNHVLTATVVLTPSAGAHTYRATLQGAVTGTQSLLADPTFPAFILVEDITGDPLPFDPESVPVGQLAYAEVTSSQTGITTEVDLIGLSVNISVPSGRVVKITGVLQVQSTAVNDAILMRIREDGTQLQGAQTHVDVVGQDTTLNRSVIVSPSEGSHTYRLTLQRSAGTGSVRMSAGSVLPAFILVEDITPTPAPASGAPGSTLGYAQVTANQGPFTAATDIIGLSSTVTVPAGRRLRISCEGLLQSTVADDTMQLTIQEGATVLQTIRILARPGGSNLATAGSVVITPSSGSHTYKIVGTRSGGTGNITFVAAATAPAFILVEDITGAVFPEGSEVTAGMIASEPWTDWSPTLTNLTLGNGTVTAKYVRIGRTIHFRFKFTLGSTSAVGTDPKFSLPAAPDAGYHLKPIGKAEFNDTGTADQEHTVWSVSGTATFIAISVSGAYPSTVGVTASVPFTWATGDSLFAAGTYEAAS